MLILYEKIHYTQKYWIYLRNSFSYAATALNCFFFIQKNASVFYIAWNLCGHRPKNIIKFGPYCLSRTLFVAITAQIKRLPIEWAYVIKPLYIYYLYILTALSFSLTLFLCNRTQFPKYCCTESVAKFFAELCRRWSALRREIRRRLIKFRPSVFPGKCLRSDPSSSSISIEK